ncbi:MAG TPA: glycoside hydrolase family 78 protein [Chthonomonadaceae bacterium]|nr:glycoside hydrolase family 78 protein [Chthonomonadaceae bacterium]
MLLGGLLMTAIAGVMALGALHPATLRCEYRTDPLGIDVAAPRLSWTLEAKPRGQMQAAYQVLVASSPGTLRHDQGDLWDSGKVASDRSVQIVYGGQPLASRQRVWWKVRVWDQQDHPSDYSAPAWWEMGLLQPADWKAQWIGFQTVPDTSQSGPAPYLRQTFAVQKGVRQARLYASAMGLYKAFLNGRRVGDDIFTPGWTDYHKRIQVQTYDVTDLIRSGQNAIGVILGDGWYCGNVGWTGRNHYGPMPRALVQLEITYRDGTTQTLVSDSSWKGAAGPILASDLLMGETYDARKEMPGWDRPRFNDAGWDNVTALPRESREDFPGGVPLVAQYAPTVQQVDEIHPIGIAEHPQGAYVFDLGQNMVGWARLRVSGPAGTTVTLRFAEMLNPDGTIYTANLRRAKCTDHYTLKGQGEEVYEPSFTFHGFRYVEVTGYPGTPGLDAITGIVVHSNTPPSGTFACSNPMVNQLQHNIVWGQRGNYLEVPTDCPQRDERLGWMGDAQIFARTGTYNMDIAAFMTKWIQDVEDAQSPEGAYSDISPRVKDDMADGAPGWGDAGVIVPWTLYAVYDDTRLIERHYESMAKWIDYIHAANPNLLWENRRNHDFGDWLNIDADIPRDVMATAYFAYDAHLLAQMAQALGKADDAQKYQQLFEGIRDAFDTAFVSPDGRIKGDTQTCYVLALRFDLLPENLRPLAAQHLVENIQKRDGHLSTGFIGVGYLLPTLTRTGHLDVAYRLLNNDTFPSWGYSIKHGATTIWERWDGWTEEKGFQNPGMNSFNHYSLGSVGEWLYETVAGIDLDPTQPGYKHMILHPQPGGGLTWAQATYDSLYGPITSDWKLDNGAFSWKVTVPANTTATVYVPAKDAAGVTESGHPANQAEGVKFLRMEAGFAVYAIGSGDYTFTSPQ